MAYHGTRLLGIDGREYGTIPKAGEDIISSVVPLLLIWISTGITKETTP